MTQNSNDTVPAENAQQPHSEQSEQVCVRCIAIRYFLIAVLGIAILALFARDKLHFLEGATPMGAALLIIGFGCFMAIAKILFFVLAQRHNLKRENAP